MTERSCKLNEVKYKVPKACAFDVENRETDGWAMTMREVKEPERGGQVGNEHYDT
ncbi:MAG: hypothetical protein IPK35_03735 [Saprospiraceae bacterium]|jgi:hypothetical protein|nr:hypothetical protein [Saprospiraceae bacterium]MBK8052397.1 hypothetical protein [Saprospiraceae bacterium]